MATQKKKPQGGTNRSTGPGRKKNSMTYSGLPPVAAGDTRGARTVQDEINRRKKSPGYTPASPRRGTGGRR